MPTTILFFWNGLHKIQECAVEVTVIFAADGHHGSTVPRQ
jgi:hypothetical protein